MLCWLDDITLDDAPAGARKAWHDANAQQRTAMPVALAMITSASDALDDDSPHELGAPRNTFDAVTK